MRGGTQDGVAGFLREFLSSPEGRARVVHVREEPARAARYAEPREPLSPALRAVLAARGAERLYTHQARALDLAAARRDFLVATGPASGKTLCFLLPLLRRLEETPDATALLLYPTKALARDQFLAVERALGDGGFTGVTAGVFDGDTPPDLRRSLRDRARILLTNPDTLHAAILPAHGRFASYLARLVIVVVDEIHAYRGIFGANASWLFHRLFRVARHHGAAPLVIAATATLANPAEHAARLLGRPFETIADDGSPRGRRTYLFVNPPRIRDTPVRSRRSANVEAAEVFAALLRRGVRAIAFSKAKITAEMIARYAAEEAPALAARIAPYRGGLLPEERRAVEEGLFAGRLLGVSATPALELGIDAGGLDAAVIAGWPGRLSSFFQQAGRAGRRGGDSLVVLVALDTPANQWVFSHPGEVFERPVEEVVFDRGNPFVLLAGLRCAAFELPVSTAEARASHSDAEAALEVLTENRKLFVAGGRFHHCAPEVPAHEVSLRDRTDRNVLVVEEGSGRTVGEVSKFDAPAIVHPGAVYLHLGETFRVLRLDLGRSVAEARREPLDYYTQSHGYDDVHHADHVLREKPFGTGRAFFGEVTAHYRVTWYERIPFRSLDPRSRHPLDLPVYPVETTAFWIEPPEEVLAGVRRDGLDPVSGLRGIGYALRSLLPLFVTCETLDLSHSIGSANTPWRDVFVWEHYPEGLGFTARGYEILDRLVPAARGVIAACDCGAGCPLCVGKPLRPETVLNPELGEGSIPSRPAALTILDGLLGDGSRLSEPDAGAFTDTPAARRERLVREMRRSLARRREPLVLRPTPPAPPPRFPTREDDRSLALPDADRRRRLRARLDGLTAAPAPRAVPSRRPGP